MELRQFLLAVQGRIGSIDIEDQCARRLALRGYEPLDQHAIERHHVGTGGARFQAREGRAAGQFIGPAYRGLHQRIVAQPIVVVQILVAAAQPVQALGDQVTQRMPDAFRSAWVAQCSSRCHRQADLAINLVYPHHASVGTDGTTAKVRFNHPPPKAPKQHLLLGTIWHRRNTPVILSGYRNQRASRRFRRPTLVKYPGWLPIYSVYRTKRRKYRPMRARHRHHPFHEPTGGPMQGKPVKVT
ncbi:MAG: hypothetical protein AMXMBFR6_04270 [Betaproteobacteria bacterium]